MLKISIITITYNNPNLARTLNSVLCQKKNSVEVEHIIVDNLSSDGTEKKVREYQKKAPYSVKYIREKDFGRYDAMNKGVRASKGEYLSFMNAGDHFFKEDSMEKLLYATEGRDFVYGDIEVMSEGKRSVSCSPDEISFKFFFTHTLPHQASFIKRNLFDTVGMYDDTLEITADVKWYVSAIFQHGCSYGHVKETIATYYLDGVSSHIESTLQIQKEKNSFFNELFSQEEIRNVVGEQGSGQAGFETPILFLVFNRPDVTQKVFDAIREIRPKRLFVCADGFREEKVGEKEKCDATRAIIKQVDWDCEVKMLFRVRNFGCGNSISKGIDWFFRHVEEGIILEDDCLPDHSFFSYCEKLLQRYRQDNRVMHINGTSFVCRGKSEESYYFSRYYHVWGWATWRRAWQSYDFSMRTFPEFESQKKIEEMFISENIRNFWKDCFQNVYAGKIDTWDYQWVYTNFVNGGLSVMPFVNLVSNIGFGEGATHTTNTDDIAANRRSGSMFRVRHPRFMIHSMSLDAKLYEICFGFVQDWKGDRMQDIKTIISLSKKIFKKGIFSFVHGKWRQPMRRIYYGVRFKKLP